MTNPYNEWLLISDIDGTLNDKKFNLPQNNKEAINRFVSNGGNFTLCSGRNLQSLKVHYDNLGIKTPAIFSNGAGIYDFRTEEMVFLDTLTTECENMILDIFKNNKGFQLTIFGVNTIYLTKRTCFYGYIISKMDKLDYKLCKSFDDLPTGEWTKASFFGMPNKIKELQKLFKSDKYKQYFDCFLTSRFTLEVVKSGVNKGSGVKKLIEYLGIESDNVGAIGDYYNDVKMLQSVAHPVCCGQAPDDIKAICEHVTCHCNDGAVCDFINYIEKNYIA